MSSVRPPPARDDPDFLPDSPSPALDDLLLEGDIIGDGLPLLGQPLRQVALPAQSSSNPPAPSLQVVRKLGSGSYAVVYLVRELISPPLTPPPNDDAVFDLDSSSLSGHSSSSSSSTYGREFAVKCLYKANLDPDALNAQLFEAQVHQSLPPHPNIVTLHRTLENDSYLLLLLEYVPGEDLFYFLERARDSCPPPQPSNLFASVTPPTPSLLSTLKTNQLLSPTRLRLIASMFGQMCDAVAACHAVNVFHRDIKPENLIVTDGWHGSERKVVVKLSDFGLATRDIHSAESDCGSAPYMSYECRNDLGPTYQPGPADVWSLGIVLINMIYHHNPWADTANAADPSQPCPDSSFQEFRTDGAQFFMNRFVGMTAPVAEFLTNKVFCILDEPGCTGRVTAEEFGLWVKGLPGLLRSGSTSIQQTSTPVTPLETAPRSRRPSLRRDIHPLVVTNPLLHLSSLSFNSSPISPTDAPPPPDPDIDGEAECDDENDSRRATSTTRRRKRGARKGKGVLVAAATNIPPPSSPDMDHLDDMAVRSEVLARELSRTKASHPNSHLPPTPHTAPLVPTPAAAKKQSKWKGVFRMASSDALSVSPSSEERPPVPPLPQNVTSHPAPHSGRFAKSSSALSHASGSSTSSKTITGTAANVSNLIMGLSADLPHNPHHDADSHSVSRGRRPEPRQSYTTGSPWSPSPHVEYVPRPSLSTERWGSPSPHPGARGYSPAQSTNSSRPSLTSPSVSGSIFSPNSGVSSAASSTNWRNSTMTTASAASSTSAFTRYSNASTRSVSTAATSVSSSSWRTGSAVGGDAVLGKDGRPVVPPPNIKIMTGIPWALDQLPRQCHPRPEGDIFGSPPERKKNDKRRGRTGPLGTINERPSSGPDTSPKSSPITAGPPVPPLALKQDAATSTTDLTRDKDSDDADSTGPKKVHKGQINTLAKMLRAVRR
ncbi:Pkinase-domain-containing protein [Sistotremastrum niveocremeum HHB9708]|uniref:non-specific serine/threonine protein kinase n=1 Tax=Sistotremastrum niveocremeum HHB9708 TaxID=1314777 RepID=A0A165A1T3_9AGAM|nr:Pkinase-domain-containing protein [Sistotremastrum niveocremeum HHB9708]